MCGCLAVAVTVAGCSDRSTSKPPNIGAIPTIGSTAQIVLPLDAYLQSDDQYSATLRATGMLTVRCMTGFGLDYTPDFSRMPSWTDQGRAAFGFVDLQDVQRAGYRWYTPRYLDIDPPGAKTDAKTGGKTALRPDQVSVLQGTVPTFAGKPVPPGGCNKVADDAVHKGESGNGADNDFVAKLANDAFVQSQSDKRITDAFKTWSTCMKQAGYSFAKPADAQNASTGMSDKDQITMAGVDFQCRQRQNLVGLEVAVDAAYQKALIDKNAEALANVKQSIGIELTNAMSALGGA
ncbi:hypothetical protein GCM10009838_50750 [Catenulispora subtropica]|uniref:Lipoprotein n=1 Tax=Catenulispora subtropica TaxID=450798 RepID=A0ABN2SA57_9ACTN